MRGVKISLRYIDPGVKISYDILTPGSIYRGVKISSHTVRQQAIIWTNVDPDLCCHTVAVGHNELTSHRILWEVITYFCLRCTDVLIIGRRKSIDAGIKFFIGTCTSLVKLITFIVPVPYLVAASFVFFFVREILLVWYMTLLHEAEAISHWDLISVIRYQLIKANH